MVKNAQVKDPMCKHDLLKEKRNLMCKHIAQWEIPHAGSRHPGQASYRTDPWADLRSC